MPEYPDVTYTGHEVEDLLVDLHDHLRATGELPVNREANRWLGEAEAVVADIATADVDETTLRERVAEARELLEHVEETGHSEADDHVAAAVDLADRILDRL